MFITKKLTLGLAVCIIAGMSSIANAATNANSTVTGNLPVLNTVENTGGSLSVSVAPETGQLSGAISTGFRVFTNNPKGLNVQFDASSTTTTGNVNSSVASAANSNLGKVVLTNNDNKPASDSITNALGSSASAENSPNAVAYKIQYTGNRANSNPVYSSANSTAANSLAPVGVTNYTIQILNDSTLAANTYDVNTDYSGAYQTTVNCTISAP